MTTIAASTDKVSFNCPHCGVLAHQNWFALHASGFGQNEHPNPWRPEDIARFVAEAHGNDKFSVEQIETFEQEWKVLATGEIVVGKPDSHWSASVSNVYLSECYACNRIALWIHERLVHPVSTSAPPANPDLPAEIRPDYDEAAQILQYSPRGSAALLRLVIQRLLKCLGGKGKNINDDIGALVAKGLDARVQQMLDVVRVIGNEAVHPGQMDLKDDRDTAGILFGLVNAIVDHTISQPARISAAYALVPESKRKEIEKRDKPKS